MSTFRATLNISSANLFPIPTNFTETVTDNVNGNYSSFNTNVLAAAATNVVLYGPSIAPGSGVLYFYVKADVLNTATVDIEISQGGQLVSAMRILAGDFAFVPIDAAIATTVRADNNSAANPATIQYFYGERG